MKGAIEKDIVAKSDLEMLTWKYKHAIDIVAELGEKFKSDLVASLKEYPGTFHSKAWRAILKNEKLHKLLKAQRLEYEFVRMLQGPVDFKQGDKILQAIKEKDTEHKTIIISEGEMMVVRILASSHLDIM